MDVLSDEFLEDAVGKVLSKCASGMQEGEPSAEEGWAYYATFADAEGNLTPKAFHDILLATATKMLGLEALDGDAIPERHPIHNLSGTSINISISAIYFNALHRNHNPLTLSRLTNTFSSLQLTHTTLNIPILTRVQSASRCLLHIDQL